jgi:hypothetical protein
MLNNNSFHEFAKSLRGELIQPGDQRYDIARKLYNGISTGDREQSLSAPMFVVARCAQWWPGMIVRGLPGRGILTDDSAGDNLTMRSPRSTLPSNISQLSE